MDRYFFEWAETGFEGLQWFWPDAQVSDEEILLATYRCEYYQGAAFVLLKRDGKLYAAHNFHCSCDGLIGWTLEETTPTSIGSYWASNLEEDWQGGSPEVAEALRKIAQAEQVLKEAA